MISTLPYGNNNMLAKKIALHTVIQVGGRALSVLFGVLTLGILTRYLGTEYFGWYTTSTTFMQMFAIVVDLGITLTLLQLISEKPERSEELVSTIFTLRVVSAAVVLGIAPLVALFLPYPTELKWGIALVTIAFFFGSLHQMLTGIFQKHLKMQQLMLGEIVGRTVLFAATVGIAFFISPTIVGFWLIIGAMGVGNALMFFLSFHYARKLIPIHFRYDPALAKHIIARAWPIALTTVCNLIYLKLDTVMLSLYRSQEEVGLYGAPYRIIEVLIYIPTAFMGLMLPVLTAAWVAHNQERFMQVLQKSFDILLLVTFAMGVGMYFIAVPLMHMIAGAGFGLSGSLLQVLTLAICFMFLSTLWSHVVIALNRQRRVIPVFFASAVVAVIGYRLFIPPYGVWGAAWMTVVVEGLVLLGTYIVARGESGIRLHLLGVMKSAGVALGMAATLWLVRDASLFILLFTGTISFFIFAQVFRALPMNFQKLLKLFT